MKEKFANFRGAKIIEILEVHVNEGNGTEDDPIYREVYYLKMDGSLIGIDTKNDMRKFANDVNVIVK